MPLDPATEKALASLKSGGAPCHFVLVKKGPDVKALVAGRKGTLEVRKSAAKKLAGGTGELSWGVVDGKGANLAFKLLRSDGFEKPPVKDVSLREFLKDCEAFKSVKATLEIVDLLPAVVSEDESQESESEQPGQSQPPQPGSAKYRTSDEWKAVIAKIQQTTDKVAKSELFARAVSDCKAESDRAKQEVQANPNSPAAAALQTLGKIAEILKKLQPTLGLTPAPLNPMQQKLKTLQTERQKAQTDVRKQVQSIQGVRHMLDQNAIAALLQECETDANSDFGQVIGLLDLQLVKPANKKKDAPLVEVKDMTGKFVDTTMSQLIAAKTKALAYVKEHKDPTLGSLPSRVKKRRDYCEKFVKQIDEYITYIGEKNLAATELCDKYIKMVQAGKYVAPEITAQLQDLLQEPLLTDETKLAVRKAMDQLSGEIQKLGYDLIAKSPKLTKQERLEIMETYGCGSRPSGGTSDVKLLKGTPGGPIEYAVKSASKESEQALSELGLPNGACAIREDVSSTIFEKFKELTKIDLGFPKSELTLVNGQPCAVIEGIQGKMADPEERAEIQREIESVMAVRDKLVAAQRPQEEIQPFDDQLQKLQAKLAATRQNIETIPDQVSAKSMTKVLVSSIMAGQWDCKWGNLIVDGDNARPIDGGAALPTLKSLDGFLNTSRTGLHGMPALEQLLTYPNTHSKAYQDLPIANQPMDQEMIDALLKLDVQAIVDSAKGRRDQLVEEHPDLGGGQPLLEDLSFDVVKDSIAGVQAILRAKQPITLKEFTVEWGKWFANWAPPFYQSHAPKS